MTRYSSRPEDSHSVMVHIRHAKLRLPAARCQAQGDCWLCLCRETGRVYTFACFSSVSALGIKVWLCIEEGNRDGLHIDREGPGVTVSSDSLRTTRPGNVHIVCTLTCHDMIFATPTNPQILYPKGCFHIHIHDSVWRRGYVVTVVSVPGFGFGFGFDTLSKQHGDFQCRFLRTMWTMRGHWTSSTCYATWR